MEANLQNEEYGLDLLGVSGWRSRVTVALAHAHRQDIYHTFGESLYIAGYEACVSDSRLAVLPRPNATGRVALRSLCAPLDGQRPHEWIVCGGKGRGDALKAVTPLPAFVAMWFTKHELRQEHPCISERFSDIFRRNLLAAHDTEHWLAFLALLNDEFVEPVAIASAMETADCSQDTHRDATFAVLTGDENGEVMDPIAKRLKLSTPPGAFASRRGTPPSDGREIASDDEDSVSWGGSAFSNPEKDVQDVPAVCASAVLETMMESDNFESKEDVATALRCRDSVDALRKEDLAKLASLIDKDTNVEKTGASRTVVLAGIRETLELVIERMHGTLTKKQIRSISFFHIVPYI